MLNRIMATLILVVASTAVYANVAEHVIAIYEFETTKDSWFSNYDGYLIGNASIAHNGKIRKCLKLDVSDKNIGFLAGEPGNPLNLIGGDFSVVAWLKTESTTGMVRIDAAGMQAERGSFGAFGMHIYPQGSMDAYIYNDILNQHYTTDNIGITVNDGRWHHFVFTLSHDFYQVFVDGDSVFEEHDDNTIGFLGDAGSSIIVNSSRDQIGRHLNKPAFVDEVGFFNTGFDYFDVQWLYKNDIAEFLGWVSVDHREKIATTWADLKSRSER